jgi:3-dehydroquinate dehydratase/shikimate dehydrogenase
MHGSSRWSGHFLERASRDRQKAIAVAMGAPGEASRILYRVLGGWATYAAPEQGDPSAPGQLSASTLRSVFHAHERTKRTRVFGLVGNPVGQSKGIYIHNPIYRSAGYDGVYVRFQVADLGRFMKEMGPSLSGCSVTLPHKREMLRYCSSLSPGAAAIGAVNTIVRKKGGWHGANTDAEGALEAIGMRISVEGKRLVIVGAGGAPGQSPEGNGGSERGDR